MQSPMTSYRAAAWLPGGNVQTIWAATFARRHLGAPPAFERERWDTPDGDFIDVDHLVAAGQSTAAAPRHSPAPTHSSAPEFSTAPSRGHSSAAANGGAAAAQHLVLFHGLEGSSASAYAQAFACVARERGWAYSVPHFRGCSGTLNRAPRAYHSGDHVEIGWILDRLRARHGAPLLVAGVSLGGNAMLRWAQELGEAAATTASAVAAICSPIDLAAAGRAIDQGFNRQVYARMFLRTMKPKALAKLQQFPQLFDRERLLAARTLYEFDDVFTAPLHGFSGTLDYWRRASAKPHLACIRIPALVLNARNDPFVPQSSLPAAGRLGPVQLVQPAQGGHVGFPLGRFPGQVLHMPQSVCTWLVSPRV